MIKNKKLFVLSLALSLVFCFLFSMISFSASCEEMYENILRVRIIANSDSLADQELKLTVRDAILKETTNIFPNEADYQEVLLLANQKKDVFTNLAQKIVTENGFNYSVTGTVRQEFFDTRVYEDFTLPSGNYETLVITIGEGKGENWWCVMFPSVCVGACSASLNDAISENSADKAYNSDKYIAKFKVVEFYEGVKNFFRKR